MAECRAWYSGPAVANPLTAGPTRRPRFDRSVAPASLGLPGHTAAFDRAMALVKEARARAGPLQPPADPVSSPLLTSPRFSPIRKGERLTHPSRVTFLVRKNPPPPARNRGPELPAPLASSQRHQDCAAHFLPRERRRGFRACLLFASRLHSPWGRQAKRRTPPSASRASRSGCAPCPARSPAHRLAAKALEASLTRRRVGPARCPPSRQGSARSSTAAAATSTPASSPGAPRRPLAAPRRPRSPSSRTRRCGQSPRRRESRWVSNELRASVAAFHSMVGLDGTKMTGHAGARARRRVRGDAPAALAARSHVHMASRAGGRATVMRLSAIIPAAGGDPRSALLPPAQARLAVPRRRPRARGNPPHAAAGRLRARRRPPLRRPRRGPADQARSEGAFFGLGVRVQPHRTEPALAPALAPAPLRQAIVGLQFQEGNFPSSLGKERDRLVQWCHGAPGVLPLLVRHFPMCPRRARWFVVRGGGGWGVGLGCEGALLSAGGGGRASGAI